MYGMVYLVQALSPPFWFKLRFWLWPKRGLQEIWDGFTKEQHGSEQSSIYMLGYYIDSTATCIARRVHRKGGRISKPIS